MKDKMKKAALEIFEETRKSGIDNQDKLNSIKKRIAKKYNLGKFPTNIEILNNLPPEKRDEYRIFTTKPVRTSSGVAIIAVMSYPFKCPHGRCAICPGGPKSFFGDVPQSYTGKEPATRRAVRNNFDPYLQVMNRLEQYVVINQIPEKIELIIMGGTFPALDKTYQKEFVMYSLKAMNDFSRMFFKKDIFLKKKFMRFFELPGKVDDPAREKKLKEKLMELKRSTETTLEKEQTKNEKSIARCVGLTVETRPDYADEDIGKFLLSLGCTRVEIGIQSLDDKKLKAIERGHDVNDSINAARTLRDLGFKLNFHMMIGLPGWSKETDKKELEKIFSDKRFRPDMLKIYPCMVMEGTKLYEKFRKKKYVPPKTKEASEIIAAFLPKIPEYARLMRVQRDIPTDVTVAGVDRTNLRQYIDNLNPKSRDIREREAGTVFRKKKILPEKIDIVVQEYDASEGKEFFISAEDVKKDILVGFIRLRFPSQTLRKEITEKSALVRELHVYGTQASIREKKQSYHYSQHLGIGKKLLKKAEDIAKKNDKEKIIIISGIGVRDYYRKHGYKKQGPYMVRTFS
ncbi:MAG: tRNA uridine(34) 5-carboxymethylaminomethyl modification radical SAM/GNAT enzyme Elp3 [Candidatus Woesearchaeota archaeon]